MAAFTAEEIANQGVALLNWYIDKGKVKYQQVDMRPTYVKLTSSSMRKSFSAGDRVIKDRVSFTHDVTARGYENDDTLVYDKPQGLRDIHMPWKEIFAGIKISHTELKMAGITIDESTGKTPTDASMRTKSRADMAILAKLLDDKLFKMMQGYHEDMNAFLWGDGTTDPKAFAGIRAFIKDNPAAANTTIANLRSDTNVGWRNYANLNIVTTANGDELTVELQKLFTRQLNRYGGKPDWIAAGSDFCQRYEDELRRKMMYSEQGLNVDGKRNDTYIMTPHFKGVPVVWEPRLDDIGTTLGDGTDYSKRAYVMDCKNLPFYAMEGEYMKQAYPPRPEDQMVWHKGMTTTCGMLPGRMNSQAVIEIK